MRIPVLDGPRVHDRPVGTPYSNVDVRMGDVGAGLREVGKALGEGAEVAQKAADQASALVVTNTEAQLQARYNNHLQGRSDGADRQPGFLSTRGLDAAQKSAELRKRLEQDRQELAGKLSERDKEMFLRRTDALTQATQRQIESHVTQQREVAAKDTVKARQEEGERAVAGDPMNEQLAKVTQYSLEGPIRALQTSPEAGDAQVREAHGRLYERRVGSLLSAGKYDAAELLLEQGKGLMAPEKADIYRKRVADLRKDYEGEGLASRAAFEARDAATGGRIDPEKAIDIVRRAPAGPARDEALARLGKHFDEDKRVWDRKLDDAFNTVLGSYHEHRTLSAYDEPTRAAQTWLKTYANEEWHKLEAIQWREAEARRVASERRPPEPKESRAQAQALIRFRAELVTNPEKYRDADYTEKRFQREWAGQLHINGLRAAGVLFADAKKDPKPESTAEFQRFVKDESDTSPLLKKKEDKEAFEALMGDQLRAFRADPSNKARAPNLEEMQKMRGAVWETKKTWWGWGPEKTVLKQRAPGGAPLPEKKKGPPTEADGETIVTLTKPGPNKGKRAVVNSKTRAFIRWAK